MLSRGLGLGLGLGLWVGSDWVVEQASGGATVASIFAENGEEAFRDTEVGPAPESPFCHFAILPFCHFAIVTFPPV